MLAPLLVRVTLHDAQQRAVHHDTHRCRPRQTRPTPAGHGRCRDRENYGGLPQPGMGGLDAGAEEWREWSTTIEKEDDMTGEPIHSGNELCENLDVLGMSAADLCRRIEVPVSRMTELLNVRRAVTGNTALRPGRVFGT